MRAFLAFLFFFLIASTTLFAYDAEIDGIYYNFSGEKAIVTFREQNNPDNYTGDIVIPEFVTYEGKEYRVTEIGSSAFYGCDKITSVSIPESVVRIVDWSFCQCSGLTTINLPKGLTYLGTGAFEKCSGLTSVVIPAGLKNIGVQAFSRCTGLTSITISMGVTSIDAAAFNNTAITAIKVPESVRSIGYSAFGLCENLVSIDIPDSVEYVGRGAFDGTPWYENQPDGLIYIGNDAYKYKGEMPEGTDIIIKEGTKGITEEAFVSCEGLTSIFIPKSVKHIDYYLFRSCPGLITINIEKGNSFYDSRDDCNAIIETATNILIAGCQNTIIPDDVVRIGDFSFAGCTTLTSITIPESVKSIGFNSFSGCKGLKSITIPNSVTEIESSAFYYCRGLTSVTLGSGITSIESGAFEECPSLDSVVCYADIPPVCDGLSFVVSPKQKCTLYVPHNSVEAYREARIWKSFTEIKDISEIETSIASLQGNTEEWIGIYDLRGRNISKVLRKGIYIQNGKKIVIK